VWTAPGLFSPRARWTWAPWPCCRAWTSARMTRCSTGLCGYGVVACGRQAGAGGPGLSLGQGPRPAVERRGSIWRPMTPRAATVVLSDGFRSSSRPVRQDPSATRPTRPIRGAEALHRERLQPAAGWRQPFMVDQRELWYRNKITQRLRRREGARGRRLLRPSRRSGKPPNTPRGLKPGLAQDRNLGEPGWIAVEQPDRAPSHG